MTENKTRRQALEERKEQKKAARSLASERAKTRTGVKPAARSKQREVESFEIKRTYAQDEQQQARIPPRRMLDFWLNFQKRQQAELKMSGVSTTGYKITDVRIVFDSQGREQGVKVSFAGGGSIRDFGDKINVFHDVRRKKPRFNKLFALLQAIKERGWAAVEGEIPPEMREIVLRVCKRVGIPLNPKEKPQHNVRASQAAYYNAYFNGSIFASSGAWKKANDAVAKYASSYDTNSAAYRKANEDRAAAYGGTDPKASAKEKFEDEAIVFFLTRTGMSHEEAVAYKNKLAPEKRQELANYAKKLDEQGDLYVKMQQLAISLDRYLTGRASAEEIAWMQRFEADISKRTGTPFKFTSLDDLKNIGKKAMNVAINRIGRGKDSLHLDEQFEAESGFHYYYGVEREDLAPAVDTIAATLGHPSVAEYLRVQPMSVQEVEKGSAEFALKQQQERTAKNQKSAEKPAPVIEKLPKDRESWKDFDAMAKQLGYSPAQIMSLRDADKGNPDKKNINRTMSYYGMLLRMYGDNGKAILKKLNEFIAAPDDMKKKMAAGLQADYQQKKVQEVSTIDMLASLKKHQKRQSLDTDKTAGKAKTKTKTKERQELAGKIIDRMAVMKARGGR